MAPLNAAHETATLLISCPDQKGLIHSITQFIYTNGGNVVDARDWAARKALPEQRNVRSRLLSTARSFLFNQVLAARVADGSWQRAQVGDLLAFTDSRSFFPAGVAECNDPRQAILD